MVVASCGGRDWSRSPSVSVVVIVSLARSPPGAYACPRSQSRVSGLRSPVSGLPSGTSVSGCDHKSKTRKTQKKN